MSLKTNNCKDITQVSSYTLRALKKYIERYAVYG